MSCPLPTRYWGQKCRTKAKLEITRDVISQSHCTVSVHFYLIAMEIFLVSLSLLEGLTEVFCDRMSFIILVSAVETMVSLGGHAGNYMFWIISNRLTHSQTVSPWKLSVGKNLVWRCPKSYEELQRVFLLQKVMRNYREFSFLLQFLSSFALVVFVANDEMSLSHSINHFRIII